ncbi:hypothetical protein THTE_0042 [Thermogutta terrifontis]|uniref:Uncharacterized protein n=1 Tax=Thermogutta terrifontis TaxID=1331910 RepID=A0A286R9K9_9BACT|nr:hypothetical protein THTE_0042 [Thermogutta terrifontis]
MPLGKPDGNRPCDVAVLGTWPGGVSTGGNAADKDKKSSPKKDEGHPRVRALGQSHRWNPKQKGKLYHPVRRMR